MKLDIKSATKSVMTNGKEVGLTLGGALASRKFLDFDVMFKAQPADSVLRKHQGIIKFLAGTIGAGMVKKGSVFQYLLNGVALEGGIKAVRTYGGGKFFEPLGEDNLLGEGDDMSGDGDDILSDILEGADDSLLLSGASVTNEYPSAVSGMNDLTQNAFNAVSGAADYGDMSGMGADDEW